MRTSRRPTASLNLEVLDDRNNPVALFALTYSQRLMTFDSSNPNVVLRGVTLTGMQSPGELITDIDVRPANNVLYGRSNLGRLYIIDPTTGFMALTSGPVAPGASVGLGFDPTTDLLREVNFSGGNLGINVSTGTRAVTGAPLRYQSGDRFQGEIPRLSSLSFTNSIPLALTTQAFAIDSVRNTLAVGVGDPNAGQFATVGFLNYDVTNRTGLAIDPILRTAYVAFQVAGQPNSLFGQVNLATGAATLTSTIGPFGPLVLDLAVAPVGSGTPTFPNPTIPPTGPGLLMTPTTTPFPTTGPTFPFPTTPFPTTGPSIPFPPTTVPTGPLAGLPTGGTTFFPPAFGGTGTIFPTTGTTFPTTGSTFPTTGTMIPTSPLGPGTTSPLFPGAFEPTTTLVSPSSNTTFGTPNTSSTFTTTPMPIDAFSSFETL
ncbi:MAG: DUF4394 domain-containing protein [Gemmataceae bacterium]